MSLEETLSGLNQLITNTMCYIAETFIKCVTFFAIHFYYYLIYVVLKQPRPKHKRRTKKKVEIKPEFDPKMLRRRQYAIDELVSSEYNYQNYISQLLEVYQPVFSKFLTDKELDIFFGRILPLVAQSRLCVASFEEECSRGAKDAEIGKLFTQKLDVVSKFIPFISVYLEITTIYNDYSQNNKKFAQKLEEIERKNEPFSSLIVMPVQRMPKYLLLLKEILKATPEWHCDNQPLKDAMTKLQEDAKIADKSVAEANRRSQLINLERSIRNCPPLLNDSRKMVGRWQPSEERTDLYLFTDLVLITKTKNEGILRKKVEELKKSYDLNKVTTIERTETGVSLNLNDTPAPANIEIKIRAKELYEAIESQLDILHPKPEEKTN